MMKGEDVVPMNPWYRGSKGEVRKTGDNKYDVFGCVRKINDTTVEITELPIHKWTQTYKAELENMIGEKGDGVIKVSPSSPSMSSHLNEFRLRLCDDASVDRIIKSTTTTRTSTSWSPCLPRTSRKRKHRA